MLRSFPIARVSLIGAYALLGPFAAMAGPQRPVVALQAYDFGGGSDGATPAAGLLETSSNTGVGTTLSGGGTGCGGSGCGTIYQITTSGSETMLYAFQGGSDGANPASELFADSAGDVYGTTEFGGGTGCGGNGCGTFFVLTTSGQEQIVSFQGGEDGAFPMAGMVAPNSEYAFGTTSQGGGTGCGGSGCGTVFKISQSGVESVVHPFKGGKDGSDPIAALIADKKGNLYGTTLSGGGTGCHSKGCGTVFEITKSGKEMVLYRFTGGKDGGEPAGRLLLDSNGVEGTTIAGGAHSVGTVFSVDSTGKEKVVYSFAGGNDGAAPNAGLLPCTSTCNFVFGTTEFGGGSDCGGDGCGTIFEIDSSGKEKILYSFTDSSDGAFPLADLVGSGKGGAGGKHGYLYGTASEGGTGCGGSGCGTVFILKY